jgi:3-deoxy-D-manno-octulosonic-acid transferase
VTIFDLLYLAGATPAAPFLAFKMLSDRRFTDHLSERFGYAARQDTCVWFHAASVGEVNAIRALGKEISKSAHLAITTMTQQGRENAVRNFPQASVSYAPLDWSPCVKQFVSRVKPSLMAVVEQELWPNMILNAPCPIAIVNARMSERSAEHYRKLGGVFRRVVQRVDLVLAQNEEYASRFRELGAPRVEVTGNLKFDALPSIDEPAERDRYRRRIGELIWVAGSTSAPEEEIVLEAYRELSKRIPALRLAIAPRHLERLPEVYKVVETRGFTPRPLSKEPAPDGIAILDTMGELYKLYAAATVVFVGGSFSSRGGQSVIEPASLGKPIVTGPDVRNIADTAESLEKLGSLKVISAPSELASATAEFLSHPERGDAGRSLVRSSTGCTAPIARSLLSLAGLPT